MNIYEKYLDFTKGSKGKSST